VDCKMCEAIKNEESIYQDWICTILDTKDKKGHEVRRMVILNEHLNENEIQEWVFVHCSNKLIAHIKSKSKHDCIIMDSTFSTIKDHFHLVACDLLKGIDRAQVMKTKARIII